MNCELVERTKSLESERNALDMEIEALKGRAGENAAPIHTDPAQVIDRICAWLEQEGNPEQYDALKRFTLAALYDAFNDFALRNGMEMPEITLGSGSSGATNA